MAGGGGVLAGFGLLLLWSYYPTPGPGLTFLALGLGVILGAIVLSTGPWGPGAK